MTHVCVYIHKYICIALNYITECSRHATSREARGLRSCVMNLLLEGRDVPIGHNG